MSTGRGVLTVAVMALAACGGRQVSPLVAQCTGDKADPNACLALAEEHLARKDEAGAREYVDKLVIAINAAPACLRDHAPRGCFVAVSSLLRESPVGLLATYDVPDALLALVPRWTGSDATGPRMQARVALQGMCSVAGRDAIEQQRACLVLGDLVDDERMRRCGPDCDITNSDAISGWSSHDVIDGYAAACAVDHRKVPAADYAAFASLVTETYQVTAATDPICGVASSSRRGASIPGALATMARIRHDIAAREASATSAAKREAERLVAMDKSKAEAAARMQAAEDAAFQKAILHAIHQSDWAATYGLLTKRRGSSIDATVATAIHKIFEPFTDWAIAQSSIAAAYLDLSSRLARAPKNHAIRVSLASLRERALVDAKKTARSARGLGATWLHAALVARIAGEFGPDEAKAASAAWTKLVATARTSLVIDNLSPACAPLFANLPSTPGARTVKAKSTLQCTIEPERIATEKEPFKVKQHVVGADGVGHDVEHETTVDVTRRRYKLVAHGVLAIYAGAARRAVPIDIDDIVDEVIDEPAVESAATTETPGRFEAALAAARDQLASTTVGEIERTEAAKAYAAGLAALKVGRKAAAENHLVVHGLLAGSSPELDEIMIGYGISFGELLPTRR